MQRAVPRLEMVNTQIREIKAKIKDFQEKNNLSPLSVTKQRVVNSPTRRIGQMESLLSKSKSEADSLGHLYHSKLDLIIGECLFNPLNFSPEEKFPKSAEKILTKLRKLKTDGSHKIGDIPYDINEAKDKFLSDVLQRKRKNAIPSVYGSIQSSGQESSQSSLRKSFPGVARTAPTSVPKLPMISRSSKVCTAPKETIRAKPMISPYQTNKSAKTALARSSSRAPNKSSGVLQKPARQVAKTAAQSLQTRQSKESSLDTDSAFDGDYEFLFSADERPLASIERAPVPKDVKPVTASTDDPASQTIEDTRRNAEKLPADITILSTEVADIMHSTPIAIEASPLTAAYDEDGFDEDAEVSSALIPNPYVVHSTDRESNPNELLSEVAGVDQLANLNNIAPKDESSLYAEDLFDEPSIIASSVDDGTNSILRGAIVEPSYHLADDSLVYEDEFEEESIHYVRLAPVKIEQIDEVSAKRDLNSTSHDNCTEFTPEDNSYECGDIKALECQESENLVDYADDFDYAFSIIEEQGVVCAMTASNGNVVVAPNNIQEMSCITGTEFSLAMGEIGLSASEPFNSQTIIEKKTDDDRYCDVNEHTGESDMYENSYESDFGDDDFIKALPRINVFTHESATFAARDPEKIYGKGEEDITMSASKENRTEPTSVDPEVHGITRLKTYSSKKTISGDVPIEDLKRKSISLKDGARSITSALADDGIVWNADLAAVKYTEIADLGYESYETDFIDEDSRANLRSELNEKGNLETDFGQDQEDLLIPPDEGSVLADGSLANDVGLSVIGEDSITYGEDDFSADVGDVSETMGSIHNLSLFHTDSFAEVKDTTILAEDNDRSVITLSRTTSGLGRTLALDVREYIEDDDETNMTPTIRDDKFTSEKYCEKYSKSLDKFIEKQKSEILERKQSMIDRKASASPSSIDNSDRSGMYMVAQIISPLNSSEANLTENCV